jgi:hypothetical protein
MAPWYPASAMKRLRTRVRVRWGWGNPFEAMLMKDAPREWVGVVRVPGVKENKFVPLPPRTQKTGFLRWQTTGETMRVSEKWLDGRSWGPEPEAWQPLGAWIDPLPDPLPSVEVKDEVRMVSIGKVAFDAVAAAAEMERDREEARNSKEDGDDELVGIPWWRDISRIRYQRRGEITREMAEGRVMRAASWCGAGQHLSMGSSLAMSGFFAEFATLTEVQALAEQELLIDRAVRFEPLTQDYDDFLTAMAWFTRLNGSRGTGKLAPWKLTRNQKVLVWRSLTVPLSFKDIGKRLDVRWTRAQSMYGAAIDRIHEIANSRSEVDRFIAELRKRNKEVRRTA